MTRSLIFNVAIIGSFYVLFTHYPQQAEELTDLASRNAKQTGQELVDFGRQHAPSVLKDILDNGQAISSSQSAPTQNAELTAFKEPANSSERVAEPVVAQNIAPIGNTTSPANIPASQLSRKSAFVANAAPVTQVTSYDIQTQSGANYEISNTDGTVVKATMQTEIANGNLVLPDSENGEPSAIAEPTYMSPSERANELDKIARDMELLYVGFDK